MSKYKVSKIIIGCDHLGLSMKNAIVDFLKQSSLEIHDVGVNNESPVDYPDIAGKLSSEVSQQKYERGILICGTGAGMAITANKFPGVRAVCVTDPYTAERAIASNNAQIITLGALVTGISVAKMLIDIWLKNEFQGGGSAVKVQKINEVDAQNRK